MSEGFWPNFDQINISHRRPCSVWIVNLLTWQNAPEWEYDEKSWEMAYNWLMMTSSGDDNWSSGSLGLLTDKTKKNKTFKKRKNRALLTLRRSQKHYEIFSNNVLRKNITRKQLRLETNRGCVIQSWLSAWVVRDFISHSLHSVVAWFAIGDL